MKGLQLLAQDVKKHKIFVTTHSGQVSPGSIFVALPPACASGLPLTTQGGESFAHVVAQAGARVIVCEHDVVAQVKEAIRLFPDCTILAVPSARYALGVLAEATYPKKLPVPQVIGLTGTNGKTTTSYLLEFIIKNAGKKVGVVGTVAYHWPGFHQDAPLTTPGCLALHELLATMSHAGVDYAIMEVSSHALDQERVAGISFEAALLTNVTQDHLDYHVTMEHYFSAKSRLFRPLNKEQKYYGVAPARIGVCNADDEYARKLLAENTELFGFGLNTYSHLHNQYLHGTILEHSPKGLYLQMCYGANKWELRVPLIGTFNAMNVLAAQAILLGLGWDSTNFACLEGFTGVPGRLEQVENEQGISAFVDYAHTPDALENVLKTLKQTGFSRIITVFGCGGNRDTAKRPLMGQVVARFSDIAILTSDNPRHEDPLMILQEIRPGLVGCPAIFEEVDRRKAIALAVQVAKPGDALLIAGKGHEMYQIINNVHYEFSDKAVLKELLV